MNRAKELAQGVITTLHKVGIGHSKRTWIAVVETAIKQREQEVIEKCAMVCDRLVYNELGEISDTVIKHLDGIVGEEKVASVLFGVATCANKIRKLGGEWNDRS